MYEIEVGRVYVTAGGWQALVIHKNPDGTFKAAHMRPSQDDIEYHDHDESGRTLESGARPQTRNFDLEVPMHESVAFSGSAEAHPV